MEEGGECMCLAVKVAARCVSVREESAPTVLAEPERRWVARSSAMDSESFCNFHVLERLLVRIKGSFLT